MDQEMICVLNDDETYTALAGCWIALVTPSIASELEHDQDPDDAVRETHSATVSRRWSIGRMHAATSVSIRK
jgi:hypothetical protein